jgi:hypothetical protein
MFALLGAAGAAALFPTVGNAAPQQQEGIIFQRTASGKSRRCCGETQGGESSLRQWSVTARSRERQPAAPTRLRPASVCNRSWMSDSRVPVELIFDQGIGDLFVIRLAGNVITDDVLGSIEYARIHLNSQLLVILGHEGCGAVTAALEAREHASSDPHGVQTIVKLIDPAIGKIDPGLPVSEQVHRAVESNVRRAQEQLKNLPETRDLRLSTVGAVYDLEGTVRWLN